MSEPIVRTSISLPDAILKKGQHNAKARLRNFSSYLADLIARDAEQLEAAPSQPTAPTHAHAK